MRKFSLMLFLCILVAGLVYAESFEPPVVTITGENVVWTDGDCEINFTLEGRDCNVYLAVYTKDMGTTMPRVDNGVGPPPLRE